LQTFGRTNFAEVNSLKDRGKMDAKIWWIVHGAHIPTLKKIALSYFDNHVFLFTVKELKYLLFYTFLLWKELVPKKNDPLGLDDFRPISWVRYVFKIISKVLENRLKTIVPQVVDNTQSTS